MGGYPGLLPRGVVWNISGSRVWLLGSWCSAQLLSRVVLGGGLLQSGRIVDSWQNCWSEISLGPDFMALWHWCCFRGTVVSSLGLRLDYRFSVWVTVEGWYPLPRIVGLLILLRGQWCLSSGSQIRMFVDRRTCCSS